MNGYRDLMESDGIDVPDALAAQMRTASADKGVAFIEGCKHSV